MTAMREAQTWLADRIPWIPHPYLRPRHGQVVGNTRPAFSTLFTIGTISLFGVIVLSVALVFMTYVAWLFFGCAVLAYCA